LFGRLNSRDQTPAPRILALIDDPVRDARLRSAFNEGFESINDQVRLVAASRMPGVELVIVPVRDRLGQSLATSVSAIRASRQGAAVYVYADRSAESLRELMQLARAGARGVIVRDVDDDIVSLHRLLERGTLARAIESIVMAAQQVVPVRQLPLVLLCLEHVERPLGANAFARRLGVSRRTLSTWASRTGSKGVRSLTSKCRVLAAIELLRGSERSIEQVAHTLQFSSSAHLHNTVRRYARCSPRDAARSDLDSWCRALLVAPSNRKTTFSPGLPPEESAPPHAEWPVPPNDATLHARMMNP
jgi:AraC-like DNA-binding protein